MKVARQFIAWYRCENGNRPVGDGMIGSDGRAAIRTINQPWVRIRPCLRDGFLIGRVPGNELPGYHHSVSTGHIAISPYRRLAVSPIRPFAHTPPTVFFLSVNQKFD
jgi:hypothetical protein